MQDKTTTLLSIDLPSDIGDRLRAVLQHLPDRDLQDITLEALEEWLARHVDETELPTQILEVPDLDEPSKE